MFKKGHEHSERTKQKIGKANWGGIVFRCNYCGIENTTSKSHFRKKKKHFCNHKCYANYRRKLPKEKQNAYKDGGMPEIEKGKRIKARAYLNHAIRDKMIEKLPCEICGDGKSEGHHGNYDKPLEVRWLCKKCHMKEHKLIYENKGNK